METKAKKVAELLKILANENRLMILCALIEGEKTAGEIAEYVPKISQSALSQHLTLLRTAGILQSDKRGMYVAYSIEDPRVTEVIETLKKHYCEGDFM
jgi:DNA-binding transcriptional ArsR family regulator